VNQSFYYLYEASHAMMSPARAWNDAMLSFLGNPANPWSQTPMARTASASAQLFERVTRRYGKPRFDLQSTVVDEALVPVTERIVWSKPFCNLIQFERSLPKGRKRDPKLLIVAPMSGHYATLLRGTVETFLPSHDVYITDWVDARVVPRSQGLFDLDSYIDYVIDILHTLGSDVHVMAVCQPAVPVIAATALMDARNDPSTPASMILIGGPIDTRKSPTAVNKLAETRGTDWFERNCIVKVPFPQAGFGRSVYPGFLQLGGFMAMNFDRHLTAHWDMYKHLVRGDGESAEKQAEFYDEYLAVILFADRRYGVRSP
jgi:poly(3-hydroxybutyrate) depolymerase